MAPSATTPLSDSIPLSKSFSATSQDVSTTLNYRIRRDLLPLDDQSKSLVKPENVIIKDIRGKEKDFTLNIHGFQYLQNSIQGVTDWSDRKQIEEIVQPATEELVKKITGATKTVVYVDRTRFTGNEEGSGMSTANSPSHGVHTDLTHASAPSLLRRVVIDEAEVQRLLNLRYIVVNVWRPIKPILRDPLAVCDWRSTNPAQDIFKDRSIPNIIKDSRDSESAIMEFGIPVFSERHEWLYLNGQKPDEPIIFKQLDSEKEGDINLIHSAFVDERYAKFPPRESIEFKIFGFFE